VEDARLAIIGLELDLAALTDCAIEVDVFWIT
jgi:hypothetical protein